MQGVKTTSTAIDAIVYGTPSPRSRRSAEHPAAPRKLGGSFTQFLLRLNSTFSMGMATVGIWGEGFHLRLDYEQSLRIMPSGLLLLTYVPCHCRKFSLILTMGCVGLCVYIIVPVFPPNSPRYGGKEGGIGARVASMFLIVIQKSSAFDPGNRSP